MEAQPVDLTFTFFIYIYYIGWATLGLFGAIWIYKDASKLPVLFLNSKPIWWSAACLLLGAIWVILTYWLIHYSSISNRSVNENT